MLHVYLQTDPTNNDLTLFEVEPNQTIVEIMGDRYADAAVYANGHPVPSSFFDHARFKSGTRIDIKRVPQDPATITAIAATVGSFVAANATMIAVSAGVSAALTIASQLLFAPSQPKPANDSFRELNAITGSSNEVISFSPMPKLFGRFRYFPPMPVTAKPYTEQQSKNQYLRQYFILSHGKLEIGGHIVGDGHNKITQDDELDDINGQRPILVGETDAGEFDDFEYEIGTPDQITLYTDQIIESQPGWKTSSDADDYGSGSNPTVEDGDSTVRTTEDNAEEISVDLRGNLYSVDSRGNFTKLRVTYEIAYRVSGSDDAWITDTFQITGDGQTTATASYHITDLAPNQYDVRLTRLTTYFSNNEGVPSTEVEWNALRTIRKRPAFDMPNCVVMAVRIRATDQLNGRLDKLSVQATSVLPVYDPDTNQWTEQPTRNPAWHFCEVWTGSANRSPFDKTDIDLSEITRWAADNDHYNLTYDAIFDNGQNTLDRVKEICTAGRAVWNVNTKISVVRETADNLPKMMITPRNSFGYSYTMTSYSQPDALKIRYTDSETWADDEVVVYDRGQNKSTATQIASIQAPGVTDQAQAIEFGRFHLANERLRGIEKHEWSMDVHHLHFQRGHIVTLQNDAIQVGLGSGRVTLVDRDEQDRIVGFESDEYLTLADDDYAVKIQLDDGSQTVARINNVSGNYVEFREPQDIDIEYDSLFVWGVHGKTTFDVKVTSIAKKKELQARITAEPAQIEAMQQVINDGEIPDFDPGMTDQVDLDRLPPNKPSIINLESDESVAIRNDDGSLQWRLVVDVKANSGRVSTDYIEVQAKPGDPDITDWQSANAIDDQASFVGFNPGDTITIRARSVGRNGNVSGWVYRHNYVIKGRVPPKPTSVEVERGTFTIKLTPRGGAVSYEFYRSGTPLNDSDILTLATKIGEGKSFTDSDLTPDTQYYYYVRAVNVYAESEFYGLTVTTKNEPDAVARNLTDYIRNGPAGDFPELKDIGKIGASADVDGSPAQRVAQEAEERAQAVKDEAEARRAELKAEREQSQSEANALERKISDEAKARADALLNQRNDLDAVIENNQTINQSRDESLANSIAEVSAGSGEQFDTSVIWYYDDELGGWSGGTLDTGYLVPDSNDPTLTSPTNIGIDGESRRYVKARIRKSKDAVWIGQLEWRVVGDSEWHGPATIDQPPVDTDGITTIAWQDIQWSGEIDQIRVQLSDSDGYALDWLAIGRPTPGASTASVQRETESRITADAAEAQARETFAAQVRGDYEGDDPAQLSRGLLFEERQNRITENSALSERTNAIETAIDDPASGLDANADAIDRTRTQVERNDQRIRSESERTSQLSSEIINDRAINLIMPPDKTPSAATRDLINSQATERVRTVTEQQGETLVNYAERLSALDSSYESQQEEIDSKASQTELSRVESNAERARATQSETLTSAFESADQTLADDYNEKFGDAKNARDSLQVDIDSKASIDRVEQAESDAKSARATLDQNLTAAFEAADAEQQTQIDNKASINRVEQVESDATGARSTLQQAIEADYTNAIDSTAERIDNDISNVESGLQTQIDSRATIGQLSDAQSDNESARATLSESLNSEFNETINSAKTEALEAAERATPRARIRYIRDWVNGNTTNNGSHWVEIQAFAGDENRALNANVTGTGGTSGAHRVTDGDLNTNRYDNAGTGLHNRVVDLGAIHSDIDRIRVFHYNRDGRTYHDTKTEVSVDGENWIALYDSSIDGEYTETSDGHLIDNNLTKTIQPTIDSKASIDQLSDVESAAKSARATLKNTIETNYNEAIQDSANGLQLDIDSRATKDALSQLESDAEQARATLSESLSTSFTQDVNEAKDQASKAQRTADNGRFNLEINPNPGEFYIYGNTEGEPDRDADFIVPWNGSNIAFARAQAGGGWTGLTGASRSKGFIGVDVNQSGLFNDLNVGFVRNNNGQWQYDNNNKWIDLDSIDSIAAIGWMEAGGDFIHAAGLFGAPVSLGLASYPSADVTGDHTARNTANVGNRSADEINNQIDSKASIDQLSEVESNAESASASLRQDVSAALGEDIAGVRTSYKARIDGLTDDVQAQFTLAVTGTRDDGTRIVGGAKLGTDGDTVDLVLSLNNLAIQSPGDDGSLVYPFIYSDGQTVMSEALIQSLTFGKLTDSSGNFIVGSDGRLKAQYIDADNLSVNYNLVVGGPPKDADRTSENTSLDTQSVDGRSSRLVRQSSQTSLTNDFDGVDGSFWTNQPQSDGTPSYIQSTDFAYSGTYSGMFQSIKTDPFPYRTGGIPRLQIPQSIADRFSGQRIRISVYALSKAFFDFGISYSVDNYGYSGWQTFRPSKADTWEKFSFVYDTPETPGSVGTYLNVWGDTSGNNYNTYIGLVTINIVSKDGDIDATKTINGPREADADNTGKNESKSTRSGNQSGSGRSWSLGENGDFRMEADESGGSLKLTNKGIYGRDGNGETFRLLANGVLDILQANVIDTLQVRENAITLPRTAINDETRWTANESYETICVLHVDDIKGPGTVTVNGVYAASGDDGWDMDLCINDGDSNQTPYFLDRVGETNDSTMNKRSYSITVFDDGAQSSKTFYLRMRIATFGSDTTRKHIHSSITYIGLWR